MSAPTTPPKGGGFLAHHQARAALGAEQNSPPIEFSTATEAAPGNVLGALAEMLLDLAAKTTATELAPQPITVAKREMGGDGSR
jgi:hypothetical protein